MAKKSESKFGLMDIPLSCSVFLEPALQRYSRNIAPLSNDTKRIVHEWNRALIDVLKTSKYSVHLGDVGRKILRSATKDATFATKCVEFARSVPLHSLHYAIRFTESVHFVSGKIAGASDVRFVDLGCGFSPLAATILSGHNLPDVYCIDMPEIIDVYTQVSERVCGRAPRSISWADACAMASSKKLDTIVAMGVLPYIDLNEQITRLKFINTNFRNFLVEIKYNNNAATAGENVFNLDQLQRLRMSAENAQTLETTLIRNSLRYAHKFICAMPGKRYFLANDRSLFLSR